MMTAVVVMMTAVVTMTEVMTMVRVTLKPRIAALVLALVVAALPVSNALATPSNAPLPEKYTSKDAGSRKNPTKAGSTVKKKEKQGTKRKRLKETKRKTLERQYLKRMPSGAGKG